MFWEIGVTSSFLEGLKREWSSFFGTLGARERPGRSDAPTLHAQSKSCYLTHLPSEDAQPKARAAKAPMAAQADYGLNQADSELSAIKEDSTTPRTTPIRAKGNSAARNGRT